MEEVLQPTSAFGKATKKAEKKAAEIGCPVVIVFETGNVVVGATAAANPASPLVVAGSIRRDQASVASARPVTPVQEYGGEPPRD